MFSTLLARRFHLYSPQTQSGEGQPAEAWAISKKCQVFYLRPSLAYAFRSCAIIPTRRVSEGKRRYSIFPAVPRLRVGLGFC
jgi:hypothetical protein